LLLSKVITKKGKESDEDLNGLKKRCEGGGGSAFKGKEKREGLKQTPQIHRKSLKAGVNAKYQQLPRLPNVGGSGTLGIESSAFSHSIVMLHHRTSSENGGGLRKRRNKGRRESLV